MLARPAADRVGHRILQVDQPISKPVAITNPANQWAAILTDTIPEMSRDRKPWILSDNDLVILMVQPIM